MTNLSSVPSQDPGPKEPSEGAENPAPKSLPDVKGLTSGAAERAQQAADEVRRRMSDGAGVARDWAADQSDVLRDTVQTKPFVAVGVSAGAAFAAGLVLGVLLARS